MITADEIRAYMAEHREALAAIVAEAPPPPPAAVDLLKACNFPVARRKDAAA